MNKSIHWTNERLGYHAGPSLSNLVGCYATEPDTAILSQDVVPESNPDHNQRCFNQLDRITQTRQDGSLGKDQLCSQEHLAEIRDRSTPLCKLGSLKATPTRKGQPSTVARCLDWPVDLPTEERGEVML